MKALNNVAFLKSILSIYNEKYIPTKKVDGNHTLQEMNEYLQNLTKHEVEDISTLLRLSQTEVSNELQSYKKYINLLLNDVK